ncbi:MAG: hypothetical protein E7282_11660 [Lachnospiraceae bacterium]|nr:hypothetical protein [Lachnospiraceae bacterium]
MVLAIIICVIVVKAKNDKDKNAQDNRDELTKIEQHLKENETENSNSDFRKWLDEYEEFMDKYVEFMKNYDSTDANQMAEYLELLNQYNDYIAATEELDESDYSEGDWEYYLEVQNRVIKKLSEINNE